METRERRRAATRRVAERRRRTYHRSVCGCGDAARCGATAGRFAKRTAFTCNCRRRTFGNPKVGGGGCWTGLRPAPRDRSRGRAYLHRLARGADPEGLPAAPEGRFGAKRPRRHGW
jgi:hypothetical protein